MNFLRCCSEIGYWKTWLQVLALVQQVVNDKGLDVKVTSGWWESFRRRHPEVKLQTAERVAYVRLVSSSSAILDRYYDLLWSILEENDLTDKPCLIFNVDESRMPLDPAALKVVVPCGIWLFTNGIYREQGTGSCSMLQCSWVCNASNGSI